MKFDEREGLPSASKIDRLYACPGSERECEGVQEFRDPKLDRWAMFGENVHLWLHVGDFIDLTPEEMEIAVQCRDQRDELVAQVFEGFHPEVVTERRFWLSDANRKRMSGQLDFGAFRRELAFVCDYKSGRGQYDDAPSNLQLRANGVLFWRAHDRLFDKVVVALVQPILGKPTECGYTRTDLERAEKQLFEILDAAEKPDAPLVAGPHCKYCPAKLKCKEARRVLDIAATVTEEKVASMDAKQIGELLRVAAVAESIIKTVRATAKQMLKNGVEIPGWTLGKPQNVRSLADVAAVWGRAHQLGIFANAQEFLDLCASVGIGDLEKAIAKKLNLKATAAKEKVNTSFEDLITTKPKEAALEQV